MSDDPWHFPRTGLAAQIYSVLTGGPAHALSLFAPRRTGKSEFLREDLGPYAHARKHRVISMSFWEAELAPLAVILHALEESHKKGTILDVMRSTATAFTPKLKLSGSIPGTGTKGEAEIDLTRLTGKPPAELLLYLDDLLGRLANAKRPAILFLDEVQELARDANYRPLIAALRTSLDKRKRSLRAVFTGSSREGLQAMFSASEAPFFHFATPIDLPMFGMDFVKHILATFARMSKRKLDRAAALRAFEALHHNPFFFRGLITSMLLNASLDIDTALTRYRAQIARDLKYPELWHKLNAIQRATVAVLAEGAQKPFSQDSRDRIGEIADVSAPSIAKVQTAIRRLASLGTIDRWNEQWVIQDPEFAAWLRAIKPAGKSG